MQWYEIVAVGCAVSVVLIFVIMTVVADVLERRIVKRLKDKGVIE